MDEGLRQRKKAQTRRALRRAAVGLAARHGPDRVTVEDIAATAGVSPRTFFNYFSSKDEAIVFPDREEAERVAAALLARPPDEPPLEALRIVFRAALSDMVDDPQELRSRMELVQSHPVLLPGSLAAFAVFERAVIDAMAVRTGTDAEHDLYPALLAAAAVAAARTSVMYWRPDEGVPALQALLDESFARLGQGLVKPGLSRRASTRRPASGARSA